MVELYYCYIVCARSPVANEYDATDKPTFIVILRSHCYSSQLSNPDFLGFQKGLAGTLFSLKLVKLSSFSDENQPSISAKNHITDVFQWDVSEKIHTPPQR